MIVLESIVALWSAARPQYGRAVAMQLRAQAPVAVEAVAACVMLDLLHSPVGLSLYLALVLGVILGFRRHNVVSLQNIQLLQVAGFTDALEGRASVDVARTLLSRAAEVCRCDTAELVLLDGAAEACLRWTAVDGVVRYDESGRTALLELVRTGGRQVPAELAATLGVRHAVLAPLTRDEAVVGLLLVANRSDGVTHFEADDVTLVELMAGASSVALERSRLLEAARDEAEEREQAALHDGLTGLANRVLAVRHLTQYLLEGETSVLVLGLDRFRDVNDSLGQDVGDELLDLLGERLADACAGDHVTARLGGDVFALLLTGDLATATQQADLVQEALERPFRVGELSVDLRVTIGITGSEHGGDASRLLQQAEGAMHEAKQRGVRVLLHDPAQADATARRLALVPDLRRAIDHGELDVAYQPKVDLDTGRVLGVEALVRWTSSRHGFVGPDEFVPLAEQMGLVSALTRQVLDKALALAAVTDLAVAVNVSPRGFADGSLLADVRCALAKHAVAAHRLTLEITEGTVMSDPAVGLELLEQLAALGVRLSVDDFGTGYSSLSYLTRLPVHEVKIDRSFVMSMAGDAADAAIVGSTVRLAHDLGLVVVAEGVETAEVWCALRALGCDTAQGYFQSRPVPAASLAQFRAEWPGRVEPLLAIPVQRGGLPAVSPAR